MSLAGQTLPNLQRNTPVFAGSKYRISQILPIAITTPIMLTKKQRPHYRQAFTILESLIVIALLVILVWIGTALFLHEKEADTPTKEAFSNLIQPAPDDLTEDSPPSALETDNEE